MDYSEYFVIPTRETYKLESPYADLQLLSNPDSDEKWCIWVPQDHEKPPIPERVELCLHFENHEWASWLFTLYAHGKEVASGCFGENEESGISLEDNCLKGDISKMAQLLEVNEEKLKKILTAKEPDVEKFVELVGFELIPVTSSDVEAAIKQTRKKKS